MKSPVRLLSFLMVCTSPPLWAMPAGFHPVGGATRSEVRRAVEAHRASQREELQREEAAAGRRLTPAELAELRSQVRQQWSPRYDAPHATTPIVSEPPAPIQPVPTSSTRALTMPRSQRP